MTSKQNHESGSMTGEKTSPPAGNFVLLQCRSLVVDGNFFVYLYLYIGCQFSAFKYGTVSNTDRYSQCLN
jgi:hypothetical protein